jgi:DNA-directed RNA polymerase subunit alpha
MGVTLLSNRNWSSLIKPSKLEYDESFKRTDNIAKVIIEPLERGFGITIGNALRRVLLSSLQGAAITSFKISGASHEFSSIPGIKEDLVDIVLNLKSVAIKMHNFDKRIIRIKASGPCIIKAGMIETPHDVEIISKDVVICTLAKDAYIDMEMVCEVGRGYVPANRHIELPIGVIAIDALFSPVSRVSYKVEDTRVGQDTDYDRLIMNIETNGAVSPEISIALAARILQDQLQSFIIFEEKNDDENEIENFAPDPIFSKLITDYDFSVRVLNCCTENNLVYIGDLVKETEKGLLELKNFGRKSLSELKKELEKASLHLGTDISGWSPPENSAAARASAQNVIEELNDDQKISDKREN